MTSVHFNEKYIIIPFPLSAWKHEHCCNLEPPHYTSSEWQVVIKDALIEQRSDGSRKLQARCISASKHQATSEVTGRALKWIHGILSLTLRMAVTAEIHEMCLCQLKKVCVCYTWHWRWSYVFMHMHYCKKNYLQNASLYTLQFTLQHARLQQIYAAVNFDGKVVEETKDKQKSTLKHHASAEFVHLKSTQ